jgi:hypothetical protein
MSCGWARPVWAKPSQSNTPLVTEVCEGEITVTDPGHPLYGRVLKLVGLACLPGHIRHCQVELLTDQIAYIPLRSTNLSTEPRSEPTVVTATAIAELVAIFQAEAKVRRSNHANRKQSARLGTTARQRTHGRRRGHRSRPHGGGGE